MKAEDFRTLRTPRELAEYVKASYEAIVSDSAVSREARLHKQPYKTFVEELLPFSCFCTWKYNGKEDVYCGLSSDPSYDAVVTDGKRVVHTVEITWPIYGRRMIDEAEEINKEGYSFTDFDVDDFSRQQEAVRRTLEIACKKACRDYRTKEGSSLLFVFDLELFRLNNPAHLKLLNSLIDRLAAMPFLTGHTLLMFVLGEQKQIIDVKAGRLPPQTD